MLSSTAFESSRRARSGPRGAFTLVEILVALSILLIFVGIVWQIAASWMRSSATGVWKQEAAHAMQRATTALRKEMEKACLPAAITPEGTTVAKDDANLLLICKAGGSDYSGDAPWDEEDWKSRPDAKSVLFGGTGGEGERTLLSFVQGSPGRERIAGLSDRPVGARGVKLKMKAKRNGPSIQRVNYKGPKKRYTVVYDLYLEIYDCKAMKVDSLKADSVFGAASGNAPFPGARLNRKIPLATDVAEVILWADNIPAGKTGPDAPVPVGLKIFCLNPNGGRANAIGRVVAHPKCGVIVQ